MVHFMAFSSPNPGDAANNHFFYPGNELSVDARHLLTLTLAGRKSINANN
jgi:hypothetical protein